MVKLLRRPLGLECVWLCGVRGDWEQGSIASGDVLQLA